MDCFILFSPTMRKVRRITSFDRKYTHFYYPTTAN